MAGQEIDRPLRWGILGCGDIAARTFAPCLRDSALCSLVAVSRRSPGAAEAFARRFDVPHWHTDERDLLDRTDIDAVVIATPPHVHCAQAVAAAEAGKHVLVEKPMALTPDECRRMMAACSAAGVRLAVAYRRRLFPQVVRAAELIRAGAIGGVTLVRTHYSGWMDPGDWRLDPSVAGGGAMMDMACHRLEVLLHLGGPALEVSAMVETLAHPWPVDDTGTVLLRLAGGALGVHSTTLTSPPRYDFAQVDGTAGKILLDPLEHWADHVRLIREEGEERMPVTPLSAEHQDLPMIEDFVRAVRAEREPVCGAAAGLHTQEVIAAAYDAARSRKTVPVAAGA